MVDARSRTAHFFTDDALTAGRQAKGRYIALCGRDVLPASLTTPERDYCLLCSYMAIPHQTSRASW
jgi:hypothetical protein